MQSKTITVSISVPAQDVYAFASNPANLPRWATSFIDSVAERNGEWIAATAIGELRFRFAPKNEFGILDHFVKAPEGPEIYVPMRVIANGDESEVIFTLFQTPGMSDEHFEDDSKMVERDLLSLKRAVEPPPPPPPKAPLDGTLRRDVTRGAEVMIVLKEDQPTGKLTRGKVKDILTSSPEHHRGIKVRLTDGQVGRVQKILG